jgi:hypothetical protein
MRRLEDFCQANVIEYLAWVAPRVFTFAIPNGVRIYLNGIALLSGSAKEAITSETRDAP